MKGNHITYNHFHTNYKSTTPHFIVRDKVDMAISKTENKFYDKTTLNKCFYTKLFKI